MGRIGLALSVPLVVVAECDAFFRKLAGQTVFIAVSRVISIISVSHLVAGQARDKVGQDFRVLAISFVKTDTYKDMSRLAVPAKSLPKSTF